MSGFCHCLIWTDVKGVKYHLMRRTPCLIHFKFMIEYCFEVTIAFTEEVLNSKLHFLCSE